MSWLNELTYNYRFDCLKCGHREKIKAQDIPDPPSHCGMKMSYGGFDPHLVKQTHVVEYEKNGRKAVAIRGKDGSLQHFSKTRLHYSKTGRIESKYTKEFEAAIQKEEQKKLLQEKKANEGRRDRMDSHFKKMVSTLPDGEYVSDGVSVKPMKSKV